MSNKESVKQTLIVALMVCIVCSVIVAGAAVSLKPAQEANKLLDRNKNILTAAGLFIPGTHQDSDVPELFSEFTMKLADLDEGRLLSVDEAQKIGIDLAVYDQHKAAKDPALSKSLTKAQDAASIGRRERYSSVYVVESSTGIETIVLPVRGYGLWGTLYGFMALESDMNTVAGLGFYKHKETPGLGAKVDNADWKESWIGKLVFASDGSVATEIVKGRVDPKNAKAIHQVDGLSGATLTSRGVHNLLRYWMSDEGYGPLLKGLRR